MDGDPGPYPTSASAIPHSCHLALGVGTAHHPGPRFRDPEQALLPCQRDSLRKLSEGLDGSASAELHRLGDHEPDGLVRAITAPPSNLR